MSKTLVYMLHNSIELQYEQQTLFRYVYEPKIDPRESSRPYFHPLKTLAGNEVTTFRPHDHCWPEQSTLLFIDQPSNPRYPTKWFVRNEQYPGVSYAFMFDEKYTLQPGEKLSLSYRIVLASGAWSRIEIEDYLARHKPA
jgi:hypothetical protein